MGLSWFRLPGTSPLFGEHIRKPVQLFQLNSETDAVGMTIFADKGMGISIIRKIIENISHYFCLDAAERELTPIMPVASEIRDGEHLMSPSCLSYRLYESRCQRENLPFARGLPVAFGAAGFSLHRRNA
jgi:hypothetical protein